MIISDFSDGYMEAEDIVSPTDIREYADAVVNKWFEYKVNFGDATKQQNSIFKYRVVLKKRKTYSNGTFNVVNSYNSMFYTIRWIFCCGGNKTSVSSLQFI